MKMNLLFNSSSQQGLFGDKTSLFSSTSYLPHYTTILWSETFVEKK